MRRRAPVEGGPERGEDQQRPQHRQRFVTERPSCGASAADSGSFSGFESRSSLPPRPTQLPQPEAGGPPRVPPKPRLATSQIPTLLGEASPRPLQKSLALARTPSLPKTSPPRIPSDKRFVRIERFDLLSSPTVSHFLYLFLLAPNTRITLKSIPLRSKERYFVIIIDKMFLRDTFG